MTQPGNPTTESTVKISLGLAAVILTIINQGCGFGTWVAKTWKERRESSRLDRLEMRVQELVNDREGQGSRTKQASTEERRATGGIPRCGGRGSVLGGPVLSRYRSRL